MSASSNWWADFNDRLQQAGLDQRFGIDSQSGFYSYPVPRDEQEATIFAAILNGDKQATTEVSPPFWGPDRSWYHP